ncbi:hypothetical protein QTH97_27950 [Variovorax sp. J22R24]|uniref:alpha/beta fold hydrolase n=1 Tax=Variovorax gracilis TaxID=3053502 RepID=UPI00257824D5|nr:hypothetical protein [Variovorax sp. J22R24]MDM0108805.1 hypothetical protein [Variovorax sp. J22R24]
METYERLNPEPDFPRLVSAVVPGWLDEGPSGHPGGTVSRIQARVLVVREDEDHLTSAADAVELRGLLPHAHLLNIPFAGHVAHADGAEVFLAATKQFLNQPLPAK